MTHAPTREQAIQWLLEQVDQLGRVRNGSVRSNTFREWRQSALTVIQRIWPGQPGRAEKFRSIPFSPPSARPGDDLVREHYERGCAEAGSLLKLWIADINLNGLPFVDSESPAPEEMLEIPADDVRMLDWSAGPRSERGKKGLIKKRGARLKEMLGLSEAGNRQATGATRKAEAPKPEAFSPALPSADPLGETIDQALQSDPAGRGTVLPLTGTSRAEIAGPGSAHGGVPGTGDDPAPVRASIRRSGIRGPASEIAALAADLEHLGIPEAERRPLRLSLQRLARDLASRPPTWPVLQEAVNLVMRSPALGRRALPLLLHYLDEAV